MDFVVKHWDFILIVVGALDAVGIWLWRVITSPSDKQLEKVKQWMIYACIEAEQLFGSRTGQVKMRYVYNKFAAQYKWISMVTTYDEFRKLVEEAVKETQHLIETNPNIREVVTKPPESKKTNVAKAKIEI